MSFVFSYQPSELIQRITERVSKYRAKGIKTSGLVESAVLVPVVKETASLIFIKRSMRVKDHKGQIAFPGGVMGRDDPSAVHTALRETHEEIGLDPKNIKVLNFLDDTISIAGYLIHPLVGLIEEMGELQPNPDEVDEVFVLPITDILAGDMIEDPGRMSWEFRVNDITIWGATARILKNFLDVSGLVER